MGYLANYALVDFLWHVITTYKHTTCVINSKNLTRVHIRCREFKKVRTFSTWSAVGHSLKNLMPISVLISFPHAHTYPDWKRRGILHTDWSSTEVSLRLVNMSCFQQECDFTYSLQVLTTQKAWWSYWIKVVSIVYTLTLHRAFHAWGQYLHYKWFNSLHAEVIYTFQFRNVEIARNQHCHSESQSWQAC